MGVPSYFSYIIKNYSNIIRQFTGLAKFHYLYMDCNSIIYDVYYALEEQYNKSPFDISDIETRIIQKTIEKISFYIKYISPTKYSYITFDGVVPLAKMNQQRKRRYKSEFMSSIIENDRPRLWNTTKITPGTEFMERLSMEIMKLKSDTIHISTSNEYGEGEQKIFAKLREDVNRDELAAVYGLDADLIMLSLFHIERMKNIYIFREAPKFRSMVSNKMNDNEQLFLDICELAKCISYEMGNQTKQYKLVYDYVFMCFFFGNDFLPHIVSLKLYGNGMEIMMNAYKKVMNENTIIQNGEINWKLVEKIIKEMKEGERDRLKEERKEKDIKGMIKKDYIREYEDSWKERYRKQLKQTGDEVFEYKRGLEWTLNYYTGKPYRKDWVYKNNYGPLLSDMCDISKKEVHSDRCIPDNLWISPTVQLAYVLPIGSHDILPRKTAKYLQEYHRELYPKKYAYQWDFCRYFWEAHPIIPEITLDQLLAWNKDNIHF